MRACAGFAMKRRKPGVWSQPKLPASTQVLTPDRAAIGSASMPSPVVLW